MRVRNADRPHVLSVRGITTAAIAVLAVLVMSVAGALIWSATLLRNTSADLVRDTDSMMQATELQLQLLAHQRVGNLVVLTGDLESIAARDQIREQMRELTDVAEQTLTDSGEHVLLRQAIIDLRAYLEIRQELEQYFPAV